MTNSKQIENAGGGDEVEAKEIELLVTAWNAFVSSQESGTFGYPTSEAFLNFMAASLESTGTVLREWRRLRKCISSLLDALAKERERVGKLEKANGRLREVAIEMPDGINLGTEMLVRDFATALAEKLYDAEIKYGYSDGWSKSDWMDECRQKLVNHLEKGDPRDVAAYCAFLWYHNEKTSLAFLAQERQEKERLKAQAEDYGNTIDSLCNYAWQKVYGEGKTDWEYPAQAIRHLVDYAGEKEREVEKLKADQATLDARLYSLLPYVPDDILCGELQAKAREFGDLQIRLARANGEYVLLRSEASSLRQELAAAKERGVEFAKVVAQADTSKLRVAKDEVADGWFYFTSGMAGHAGQFLLTEGLLEKHPDNSWYRWTAASKEEKTNDE